MVQIRRVHLLSSSSRAIRRGLLSLIRFLLMAGLMPLLFLVRGWLLHHNDTILLHTLQASNRITELIILQKQQQQQRPPLESDIVELDHCHMQDLLLDMLSPTWTNFSQWAGPILNETLEALIHQESMMLLQNNPSLVQDVEREFAWELLEQYVTSVLPPDRCDYNLYRPTWVDPQVANRLLNLQRTVLVPVGLARIFFTIVVHKDVPQLGRLVAAIHAPYHYILIHVDRHAVPTLVQDVTALTELYDNVFLIQFGSIVYRTDLVSHVHWRLLQFVTDIPQLLYDYHVALDGSTFPLQNAHDLAQTLHESNRNVYLGELTHRGMREVPTTSRTYLLRRKRLIHSGTKLHKRLPRALFYLQQLPVEIIQSMKYKSNSGNQIVLSFAVVQKLLASTHVRQMFALSKYGCCCCLEERTWIAALHMIGYGAEALEQASVFQLWGGVSTDCESSMHNAILTLNASLCYRYEDATDMAPHQISKNESEIYLRGNEVWDKLQDAKVRGFLFARKFQSENAESMKLLKDIQELQWQDV